MAAVASAKQKLMTPEEAAEYLGLSTQTLANWRPKKIGPPYIKLEGKSIRYRVESLERWLEENTVGANDQD